MKASSAPKSAALTRSKRARAESNAPIDSAASPSAAKRARTSAASASAAAPQATAPPQLLASVTASAASKVLVIGGYTILKPGGRGLSLTTSARFATRVRRRREGDPADAELRQELALVRSVARGSGASGPKLIAVVRAPQHHKNGPIVLSVALDRVVQLSASEPNPFVENALVWSVAAVRAVLPASVFSQVAAPAAGSKSALEWIAIDLKASDAFYTGSTGKTGLGSSAALVASFVAAVMRCFGVPIDSNPQAKMFSHDIAQLAHSAAQGKTGSGFDIGSAFYGSQQYGRFPPEALKPLIDAAASAPPEFDAAALVREHFLKASGAVPKAVVPANDVSPRFAQAVTGYVEGIGAICKPATLPRGIRLVLGDVAGGSKTVGMVRKILARHDRVRKASVDDTDALWDSLSSDNVTWIASADVLRSSSESTRGLYSTALRECAERPFESWDANGLAGKFRSLGSALRKIRAKLKKMGAEAGVDVEPDAQTALCDATQLVPGCLGAGVPGAGGFDAIFALCLSEESQAAIERMWLARGVARIPVSEDARGVVFDEVVALAVPAAAKPSKF